MAPKRRPKPGPRPPPTYDGPAPVVVLGVDPGTTGYVVALSLVHDVGRVYPLRVRRYGRLTALDLSGLVKVLAGKEVLVVVEEVCGRGGWGAHSNFTFGATAGGVVSAALAVGWGVVSVLPTTWQAPLHYPEDAGEKPKERTLRAYQRLFPGGALPLSRQGTTDHNAIDALLIAWWGVTRLLGLAPRPWKLTKGGRK